MHFHARFKNIPEESHARIEQLVRMGFEKHVAPRLRDFRDDLARLYASIERNRHHENLYRVKLRLELPRKVLVAREDEYGLEPAIDAALEELLRQVDRHIHRLRQDDQWRRKGRRRELRRLKEHLGGLPGEERVDFIREFTRYAPRLERVIRRELGYLRAEGHLGPDWPTVQDVLDETLVRAQHNLPDRPAGMDAWHWLLSRMMQVLEEEMRRWQEARGSLSMERAPREDAMDEAEDMVEEEIMEFYQPDAALHIEDMVPDEETADPEALLEHRERAHLLFRLLAHLPVAWRRAVELVQIEGLSPAEVAALMGVSEADVLEWLKTADLFLRAKLADAGFDLPEPDSGEPAIQGLLMQAPPREEGEDEAELRAELESLAE
ncbi:MAG: hypothetical protein D6717_11625 [Gammaproteobacteria bacterium]|nr:MAG: hypothetical protein D6717_11625 [Gammaproteobacteria bacterium]